MTADEEAGWIMVIVSAVFFIGWRVALAWQDYKHSRRFTREIQRKAWGKR